MPVIGVKGCDVPRYIRRYRANEARRIPKFLVAVVEPRDDQRDHFHPHAKLACLDDAVQHRLQSAPALPVLCILHGFQVHLESLHARLQVLQHFGGGESVGDVHAVDGLLDRQTEDLHRPLAGDQRFIVG